MSTDAVKWKCNDCLEVIRKMPKRTKHSFQKIQQSKSRKLEQKTRRQTLNNALNNTRIIVGAGIGTNPCDKYNGNDLTKVSLHLEDKQFTATFDLCPKVYGQLFIFTYVWRQILY